MAAHIWSIITRKESLWVKWIHTYKLSSHNFWAIRLRDFSSTGWRKILNLRESVRLSCVVRLGNGRDSSAWFDNWSNIGPLDQYVTPREIHDVGFNLKSRVADIWNNGWNWPHNWNSKAGLNMINDINITIGANDCTLWRDTQDKLVEFSVKNAWDTLRQRQDNVDWHRIMWFSQCIP